MKNRPDYHVVREVARPRGPSNVRSAWGFVVENTLAYAVSRASRPAASRPSSSVALAASVLGVITSGGLQAAQVDARASGRAAQAASATARGFVLIGVQGDSGRDVSGAGDVNGDGIADIVIGAHYAEVGGEPDVGEAYVVFGRTTGFPDQFALSRLFVQGGGDGSEGFVLEGVDDENHTGWAVAGAGDVNGDGVDDVVIGAPYGSSDDGRAFVVFGRATGFPAEIALATLLPENGGDGSTGFVLNGFRHLGNVGISVAAADDVNGDGLDDLVIGNSSPNLVPGESYVVFGRSTGFPALFELSSLITSPHSEGFVLTGTDVSDRTGAAVSAAGDVDADGLADLIIGAPNAGQEFHGESYVVFGRATGYPPIFPLQRLFPPFGNGSEGFVLKGVVANGKGGSVSANAGDINGDGIGDVVVTDVDAHPGGDDHAGATYVVFGRASGFPAAMSLGALLPAGGGDGSDGFVLTGIDERDYSGRSAGATGDLNGDGYADLVISANGADPGGRKGAGEVYVVFGRASGFPPVMSLGRLFPASGADGTEGLVIIGADGGDNIGASVDGAGDVDGDGIDDLLIGAPNAGNNGRGKTYVLFGSSEGFPPIVDLRRLGGLD